MIDRDRSDQRKKWKREISAGGVVYKKSRDKIYILLTGHKGKQIHKGEWIWAFPKGWIGDHPGERIEETAVWEVREEGGVNARIEADLGELKYFFKWAGEDIFKIVKYYLMEYVSGDPADHDFEVEDAKWVELSEAEKTLTFREDKEVLAKAREILAQK